MLYRSQLHQYQDRAVDHITTRLRQYPYQPNIIQAVMLWLDIGLGKTVSALTALSDLMAQGVVYGVLILAPLRVCQSVWEQEAQKWTHLKHLTFSLIHGNPNHRIRALRKSRNIYLLNYEGLPEVEIQLIAQYFAKGRPLPFNCVVLDEVTMIKSARMRKGGKRARSLLKLLQYVPYRIGLTGTPAPNGLLDLFGQYLVLDGGRRLGTSYSHYRDSYFSPDVNGYRYYPTNEGKGYIYQAISDITLQMSARDYLDLPPVTINNIEIDLPSNKRDQYEELEKNAFLELESGITLDPVNRASLINKCLQFANGATYHTPKDPAWEWIHDAKLDALSDILEELGGRPLLVGYQFRHDAQRIVELAEKKGIDHAIINSKVKKRDMQIIVNRWNNGDLPLMIGHGKSMGHGLNLQYGANHIAWFGLPWSSELYTQLNGRLARQGQTERVILHQLLIRDTFDYAVLEAQRIKAKTETELRTAIYNYREAKAA